MLHFAKGFLTFPGGIWVKVFKNGTIKICGGQPLKSLKLYGLLRQAM